MILYKNVDISDLDKILEQGVLPINITGNDNWEDGKRATNSKDYVYLFAPKSSNNSFPGYGVALLQVECDAAPSIMAENDHYKDKYDEYIVKMVNPKQILNVYIPSIFKNRMPDIKNNNKISFVDITADIYDGFRPATKDELNWLGQHARFEDTWEDQYMRGVKENREVVDFYNYHYEIT